VLTEIQVLALPHLDERLFRRCSQLLYMICKAHGILPASHIVQPELIHGGEFEWGGGFADVGKGEYQGRPVAIKQLRIRIKTEDEIHDIFKVCTQPRLAGKITITYFQLSGFVRKFSFGNTCLIPTSCLSWEFLCLKIPGISASSLSGCPTGMWGNT